MENLKIELKLVSLTALNAPKSSNGNAYAMILRESDGDRELPIVIGAAEAQALLYGLRRTPTPRPLTHDLLEGCLRIFGIEMREALIYKAKAGVFYMNILLQGDDRRRIDARPSDAIALALRYGAPIYIYEDILEAERIRSTEEMESNLPSKRSLELKMEQAIAEENYELAAELRERIEQMNETR
jgi:bifunctional DNase/RNase